jgi:tripartite-type tricarboxylate transporter receptor subunit TctC
VREEPRRLGFHPEDSMKTLKTLVGVSAALAVSLLATSAFAQTYPERTITMVVPFSAGGPTDTVTRLVAEAMSKDLGQQIVVENVGGAGGTLGAGRVASADPDGYTLLLHHIGMATSATLYRKLAYDTLNAFEYVGLVTDVPMTIVARKDLEPTDLKGLIDYMKANKDTVTVANAGIGAASHLCGMMLMSALQTQFTTVPYKGTGPAMTDLLGGQVDVLCDQTTNTTKQIQGGTIKAYAVTSPARLANLPDIPTAEEGGLPGFQIGIWHGVYAPKGTPAEVTERLSKSLQLALKAPNVVARFAELGTTPSSQADATPAALKAKLESEIARWKPIIEAAGQFAD